MQAIRSDELFADSQLFSQGAQAGEFVFLSADGRSAGGTLEVTVEQQTKRAIAQLGGLLNSAGLSLSHLVSLMVFLPNYGDASPVASILRETFKDLKHTPAITLVGVCDLEENCKIRLDALAVSNGKREAILLPDLPLPLGARCHGVRVDDLVFLSGMDASDAQGKIAAPTTIQEQTTEVLARIRRVLATQQLGLGHLCRTFMFMPGTQYRPGYGEARRKVYQGIFKEDEFPPNSGIYIRALGENILLRSVASAYRGKIEIVASDRVRKAPGSFSQSVRVGDWLILAGQDAVGFNREVKAEGSLAGQTEATLQHSKDIVEAAGGRLADIVKTTVYLTEGTDRKEFAEVYRRFFAAHSPSGILPAGLTVTVQELSPRCMVEIDSVAYLGRSV